MNEKTYDRETLKPKEPHPASASAINYIKSINIDRLFQYLESFSSCAIENNRLAEICYGTLNRILNNEPVSDRYLLGLAWTIKTMEDKESKE